MKNTIYIILFIVSIQAKPQKNILPLDTIINLALKNFPKLKAAQLSVEKQNALKSTAYDFGITSVYTGKEEVGNNSPGIYNKIIVEQNDINLFSIFSQSKLINAKKAQAEKELNLTKKLLIKKTKKAWLNAVAARKQLILFTELDSLFVNFEKAAELRYKTQQSSKIEYLSAATKYKEVQIAIKTTKNKYYTALQELNYFILQENTFDVDTNLSPIPVIEIKGSIENSSVNEYYKSFIELAKSEWKSEKSNLLPKINVLYKLQDIDNISGFYAWQAGISIPLVFFSQSGKNKAAKINYEIADYEYQTKKAEINIEYKKLINKYLLLKNIVDFYKKETIFLANEQIKATNLAYKLGNIDYIQFTKNIESAIKIKSDYIFKEIELHKLIAEIEFLVN